MLSEKEKRVLSDLRQADGASFSDLILLAGMNPSIDFRGANLRGVDFGNSDLSGFDFTGADLTGANFENANTSDAKFDDGVLDPHALHGPGGEFHSGFGDPHYRLRPFQEQIISLVLSGLREGKRRGVISMPLGSGRGRVIEEIISRLERSGDFKRVLIIVDSAAERMEYKSLLSSRVRHFSKTQSVQDQSELSISVEVQTVHKINMLLKRGSESYHIYAADCVIFLCTPNRLMNLYPEIDRHYDKNTAFLAFVSPLLSGASSRTRRSIDAIIDIYDEFYHIVTLSTVLESGMLTISRINNLSVSHEGLWSDPREGSGGRKLCAEVFEDVVANIKQLLSDSKCLIICEDQADATYLADELRKFVNMQYWTSQRSIIALTPHLRLADWIYNNGAGSVVIACPRSLVRTMPNSFVWDSDLVIVLCPVADRLLDILLLSHPKSHGEELLVLDYDGNLTDLADRVKIE